MKKEYPIDRAAASPDAQLDRMAERVTASLNAALARHQKDLANEAKSAPKAHRDVQLFDGDLRYRYVTRRRPKGPRVLYCWSTVRNIAGYYLTWREIEDGESVRQDMVASWRVKQRAIEYQRRLADEEAP